MNRSMKLMKRVTTPSWRKSVRAAAAVAAAALGLAGTAHAASFVDLQILGSTDGNNYSSSVSVTAGQNVYFEVVGEIEQTAVTNANHPYTLVQPQVSGTDGISSLNYNLNLSDTSASFTSSSTGPSFTNTLGSSGGTASGNNLTAVNDSPATPGAFYGGTAQVLLLSGTLTAGSAQSDLLTYSFNSGAFRVNTTAGQKGITANATTESGSDPYIVAAPLTLSGSSEASAVPAPGVVPALAALAAAAAGVTRLRRRTRIA